MPLAELSGVSLHYETAGREANPPLVLANSLGTNLTMWDAQMPALERGFRVVRFDMRGHGKSSVPAGPYTMAQLGGDVVGLLDALAIPQAFVCGVSLGGMVGQWLGIHAPSRVRGLVLADTAAKIGTAAGWNERMEAVRLGGMAAMVEGILERWFTSAFRAREPETVERFRAMLLATPADGYIAACAAIRDVDFTARLPEIGTPCLVIAGSRDEVTTVRDAEAIVGGVAKARPEELPAAHISNVECAAGFTAAVVGFLAATQAASGSVTGG